MVKQTKIQILMQTLKGGGGGGGSIGPSIPVMTTTGITPQASNYNVGIKIQWKSG